MGSSQLRPSPLRKADRFSSLLPLMCPYLPALLSWPHGWESLPLHLFFSWRARCCAGFPEPSWPIPTPLWPSPQIITSEEAERRGQIYDRQGATYLFDLDYVEDVYTVDAAYYGNISHFVNHSVGTLQVGRGWEEQAGPLLTLPLFVFSQCDPNLQVYNVFIDNLDERLPRIAFFATRTIWAGEELTFDYNMQGGGGKGLGAGAHSDMGHNDPSPKSFKML